MFWTFWTSLANFLCYFAFVTWNLVYSHPLVSTGDWFQEFQRIPKSTDAQVPYVKGCSVVWPSVPSGSASPDLRIHVCGTHGHWGPGSTTKGCHHHSCEKSVWNLVQCFETEGTANRSFWNAMLSLVEWDLTCVRYIFVRWRLRVTKVFCILHKRPEQKPSAFSFHNGKDTSKRKKSFQIQSALANCPQRCCFCA